MTTFAVAKLTLLPGKGKRTQTATANADGSPTSVDVQFNPTSLRVQRTVSQRRSGMSRKDQQVQFSAANAATLTFDLEFDTAEEVGDSGPVSVRTRTDPIRELVEPPKGSPAGAPKRVVFEWGSFAFQGVVTQIVEEFDYFAPDGTPLRAKMSMTIEEQDPRYAALEKGSGARTDRAATGPGGAFVDFGPPPQQNTEIPPGPQPGHGGTRDPLASVPARAGESVQQLATRVGGDPGAWRSLMSGLTNPVGLAAGTPVIVGPELDFPAMIGQAFGFAAGATTSRVQDLATALGLTPASSADLDGPIGAALDRSEGAGFAISAVGGIAAASEAVLAADTAEAVRAARSAFDVPSRPDIAGDGAVPTATGRPLSAVDQRALSYGRAVPLRGRVNTETGDEARAGGSRSLAARARPAELSAANVRSTPPWERLPQAASGRAVADLAQRGRDARFSTIRWKPGGGCR